MVSHSYRIRVRLPEVLNNPGSQESNAAQEAQLGEDIWISLVRAGREEFVSPCLIYCVRYFAPNDLQKRGDVAMTRVIAGESRRDVQDTSQLSLGTSSAPLGMCSEGLGFSFSGFRVWKAGPFPLLRSPLQMRNWLGRPTGGFTEAGTVLKRCPFLPATGFGELPLRVHQTGHLAVHGPLLPVSHCTACQRLHLCPRPMARVLRRQKKKRTSSTIPEPQGASYGRASLSFSAFWGAELQAEKEWRLLGAKLLRKSWAWALGHRRIGVKEVARRDPFGSMVFSPLGPPARCPFSQLFWGEGPTKID